MREKEELRALVISDADRFIERSSKAVELSRKLNPITIEGMILAKLPGNWTTVLEKTFCPEPSPPQKD